jgi:protein-tyrosine phosphatase/nicotinamidase-related amidase
MQSILITQCLQNDFVQPIGRFDPIPNFLHVGYHESTRLMGEDVSTGPVARLMSWVYDLPDEQVRVIHIRDWHDPADPAQAAHLELFGDHCIQESAGAEFAFSTENASHGQSQVVDSLTLNDFQGTALEAILDEYAGTPVRVGIVGVWTEAKVSFLAYELTTRYPSFEIAVCSALTASSTRQGHFDALDQMRQILGVKIFDSPGAFMKFLGGESAVDPGIVHEDRFPVVDTAGIDLRETDLTLVRYLFRDCREVKLKVLEGGFSGNLVAMAESIDIHGHDQVPHVIKIGAREEMGKERASFERVQDVLGNNAPQISDFADSGERGGIKYRYASMGGEFATTFQKDYESGLPLEQVEEVIDTVFGEQLMRLYKAAVLEDCDLLDHYFFSSRWAGSVRSKVEALLGGPQRDRSITLLPGLEVVNVCDFYEDTLAHLPRRPGDQCYQAYVHGDLNGANIILDDHRNVWLIDFFHTRRAHVLMDLIKLENDVLYIYTPIQTDDDLRMAAEFTDELMKVRDLAAPLPDPPAHFTDAFVRAWGTVKALRKHYGSLIHSDRGPFQLWVAQLRYAVHTLGFDESDDMQRRWALYTAGRCVEKITAMLSGTSELRLDWLPYQPDGHGRLGMTLLPGRKDYGRDLARDIQVLKDEGVRAVGCFVTHGELERYGVGDLIEVYRSEGFDVLHVPIADQKVGSREDAEGTVNWISAHLSAGDNILLHCVGGLGRTGMLAGCYLKTQGYTAGDALTMIRETRSPRAVETRIQEEFVENYD